MQHLTIRNVSPELAKALEDEKRRRGTSMNQTVLRLLEGALGVGVQFDNGLADLAGRWTQDELESFEEAVAIFEAIDEEQWR